MSTLFLIACLAVAGASGEGVLLENEYLGLTIRPDAGGIGSEFTLKSVQGNQAGPAGVLQEGFGVPSPYIPNRRVNEKSELTGGAWQYSYDCQGPNIDGLHVTRRVEPVAGEASVRVRWRVENQGKVKQWMAPWVRNDAQVGGAIDAVDRIDLPTLNGIMAASATGYHPLARNWTAVTDATNAVSLCAVFNSDHIHSALAIVEPQNKQLGFQGAFVPRMLNPGEVFETIYRLNLVRGLKHVDFASQEIAAQVDYTPAAIQVFVATVKPLKDIQIHASVLAENGRRWKLAPKKFSTDPNRVIRCTFEWKAPGNGVYQFLAQLTGGNGQPMELNSELAPPHGGIDTQFSVGTPGQVKMEAWTDAPHALDRGARKRARPAAKFGDGIVWAENSLEKVYPQDVADPQAGGKPVVRLSLARNESESFQLVVRPRERELLDVAWKASDLVCNESSARIPANSIQACNVRYYPVTVPSHFEGPTGPAPDALPPFKKTKALPGQSTPIWFTLHTTSKTAPGLYRGQVELTAVGAETVRVPVEVQVYDFELPVIPNLKTDFFFWPEKSVDAAKKMKTALTDQEIVQRYLLDGLEHRVTLRMPNLLPGPGQMTPDALNKSAARIQYLLGKGLSTIAVSPTMLEAPAQLQQLDAFVAKQNLAGRAFCPVADSPGTETWTALVAKLNLWRQYAPHIPTTVTTYGLQPFLNDGVDIWNIHTQIMDTANNAPVLERLKQGKEVWWFLAQGPARPYANFFIDFAGIEHRILFWQTWALGLKGVHYWGVNNVEPGVDPYVNQLDATPVNGDGLLVYPGSDGPVDSIRWEIIRDGIEDYDYLVMFTDRLQKAKQLLGDDPLIARAAQVFDLKSVVPDLVTYPRDPDLLYKKRDEIARTLVELSRASS